jgi:threonine 3-dehydrogenase
MSKTMRALVKGPEYGLELRSIPIPDPDPGQVLVQVKAAAICGSDLRKYRWSAQDVGGKLPVSGFGAVLGHEYSGVIVDVGEGVSSARIGERVSGETHIPCGHCYQCRHGQQHICSNLRILGSNLNGCFAEFVAVPDLTACRIPDELSFESGALMEPFGVGVHASERAQVHGQTTLVLGAGPIGLFTVLATRALGADLIWSSELSESRRELAGELGADHVLDPRTDDVVATVLADTEGVGCDVSIETSGALVAFQQGLRALRKGGRLVVAGTPAQPIQIEDGTRDLLKKEATIMGIHGREMFRTWDTMNRLVTDLGVDPGIIITHRFALEDFQQAFNLPLRAEGGKMLLIP